MKSLRLTAMAVLLGIYAACGPMQQQPPINETPAVDALEDPNHPGLEACMTGHTSADIESTLNVASRFKESAHELIVCGGIASSFSSTLITVILTSALGKNGAKFEYQGDGKYFVGDATGNGTAMTMTVRLHQDTSFGKKGDVVPFDLLKVESFITGATLKASASINTSGETKYTLSIDYTGKGPAFELLGIAEGSVSIDAEAIAEALGKLEVVAEATVIDEKASSTFTYNLGSDPTPMGKFINGGALNWGLKSFTGGASDTGQALELGTWDIRYSSHAVLDGTISFAVKSGGAFDYGVTFEYPMRAEPDVMLSCGG